MRSVALILAVFVLILGAGCSRYVQVTVDSDPYGATLVSCGKTYGQCPLPLYWKLKGDQKRSARITIPDMVATWPSGATKSSGPVLLNLQPLCPKNPTLYALRVFFVGRPIDTFNYTLTRDCKGDADAQALQYDQQMGEQLRSRRIQAAEVALVASILMSQQANQEIQSGYDRIANARYGQTASTSPASSVVPLPQSSPLTIESWIEGEFKGREGNTVVRLANGQVWQECQCGSIAPHGQRSHVTLVQTSDGWQMLVDGAGSAVRVIPR